MSPCPSRQLLLVPGQQSVLVPTLCRFPQGSRSCLPEQLEPSGPRLQVPVPGGAVGQLLALGQL